jgi:hypothetical protein
MTRQTGKESESKVLWNIHSVLNWFISHVITIKNGGKKVETYTLWHEPAGTVISLPDEINYKTHPVDHVSQSARVRLSRTRVTLLPGASTQVTVTITPPTGLNPRQLPLVSGWIHVNAVSHGGDRLRVSYMGFAGKLKEAQAISTGNDYYVPQDGGLPAILQRVNGDGEFRAVRTPIDLVDPGNAIFAIA